MHVMAQLHVTTNLKLICKSVRRLSISKKLKFPAIQHDQCGAMGGGLTSSPQSEYIIRVLQVESYLLGTLQDGRVEP